MEFELTPEIIDEIIFAMEDQTNIFFYDSAEHCCVCDDHDSPLTSPGKADDRYYELPSWDSISGFRMMEHFVSQLGNPLAREELRSALSSGRGVFRSFKNILKAYPEVEHLWYQFKEREMKNIVYEWYNSLRDYWGLERIGTEPEETDEIVVHDFFFREYTIADEDELSIVISSVEQEMADEIQPALFDAIDELWKRECGEESEDDCVLVVEGADNKVVGTALSTPIPVGSFFSAQLTTIAVLPEFRGLGIGKELLDRTILYWINKGYRWLLYTAPVIPSFFTKVIQQVGFIPQGRLWVLDLSEMHYH